MYKEKGFNKPPKTFTPPFKHDHATLKFPQELQNLFTTLFELHAEIHPSPPQHLLRVETNIYSPPTPSSLYKSLLTSEGLFFIQYTLEDTFKSCWYLVKINYDKQKI